MRVQDVVLDAARLPVEENGSAIQVDGRPSPNLPRPEEDLRGRCTTVAWMRMMGAEGQTFVVTWHGVPIGKLTPLRQRRFIRAEAVSAMLRNAPGAAFGQFRTDLAAIATR